MKIQALSIVFVLWLGSILVTACRYDVGEELYPPCDTISVVSFSAYIVPVLQTNCYSCHSEALALGGYILEGYDYDTTLAANGKLIGAITHETGLTPMPQNAAKLSDCDIAKFKNWVANGYPNN